MKPFYFRAERPPTKEYFQAANYTKTMNLSCYLVGLSSNHSVFDYLGQSYHEFNHNPLRLDLMGLEQRRDFMP